jgi:hypothetical protein
MYLIDRGGNMMGGGVNRGMTAELGAEPSPLCHPAPVLPDGAMLISTFQHSKKPMISAGLLLCMGLFSHFLV